MSDPSLTALLERIDSEIHDLLKNGKLSALNYCLPVKAEEKTNRVPNLKALLVIRRHYRELADRRDNS